MNPLKLSKVVRAAVPIVANRPPFGASGFTHSKCLKSGGYLSSPNADRPCLLLSAAAPTDARRKPADNASFKMCMSLAPSAPRSRAIASCRPSDPIEMRKIWPVLGGADQGHRVVIGEAVRSRRDRAANKDHAGKGGKCGPCAGTSSLSGESRPAF